MSLHTDDVVIANTPLPIEGGNSTPVLVTSSNPTSSTGTSAQVVLSQNVNSTILASNASRKGAILFIPLATTYIKFGAVASSTSFAYQTNVANSTIEIPFGYTGRIDAFSTSAQTVTITEMT